MSAATIAAVVTAVVSVLGAVTALVATWRHITGPAHQATRRP